MSKTEPALDRQDNDYDTRYDLPNALLHRRALMATFTVASIGSNKGDPARLMARPALVPMSFDDAAAKTLGRSNRSRQR